MDNEVLVYVIPKPAAVPASAITAGDWTTNNERLDALEELDLNGLADVDTAGVIDGQTIVYDSASTPPWQPGSSGGTLERVRDTVTLIDDVDTLYARLGLQITTSETVGRAYIQPQYAGTGSADTVARSDHSHSAPKGKRGTFEATGVLSSGTRQLVSETFGPLTSGITYDVEAWFLVRARNNVNSGTFNLLCRVGTDGDYPQLSRNVQTVGGVPVDQHIDFGDEDGDMVIVGTGASIDITFSAQFSTGDAVDLRDGFFRVIARPRR